MLFRTASLVVASSLALGAPAVYAAPQVPVAVQTVKAKAPQQSPDATNYAEREKQDTKAADFQGGDVVVIGVTGGTILVLLLLLLILA